MFKKIIAFLLVSSAVTAAFAQQNFSYFPAKPQKGETITISYEPAGDISHVTAPIEAVVYQLGGKQKADDLKLTRVGNKYTGQFVTDTANNFVYLSFAASDKFDNNSNDGYKINIYDGDKTKKGSFLSESAYYQYYCTMAGIEANNDKAIASIEKEFEVFPESKNMQLVNYVSLKARAKKDEAPAMIQKEIEKALKAGLKEEADYERLAGLYQVGRLPEQAKMVTNLKKEKFPNGKWVMNDEVQKFLSEQDLEKKEVKFAELSNKINTDEKWESMKSSLSFFQSQLLGTYVQKKNWDKLKAAAASITDKSQLASLYNNAAWQMQLADDNLDKAEEMSKFAATYTRGEWKKPTAPKPDFQTMKQWQNGREKSYAMYADTYAMILFKKGMAKQGFPYANDAAIVINKGNDADLNNTYTLLAEKVVSAKKLKPQLEQFVKNGKAGKDVKEVLKNLYVAEKKSSDGYDEYITALQEESRLAVLKELQKSMLDETAPSFALVNLDGKKTDIGELKGKVVVVDFWATWCGPCKASFPGMQKMVNKYKDNPNVKFVFIDTWENVEDKKKVVSEFINTNKYSFDVWMDNDNKVVEQFKVEGIPTKFVIDKTGKIRFKAVGFSGSDDKLIDELTAMIDMASNSDKKAF